WILRWLTGCTLRAVWPTSTVSSRKNRSRCVRAHFSEKKNAAAPPSAPRAGYRAPAGANFFFTVVIQSASFSRQNRATILTTEQGFFV
ncbi:unnamed protein product, partial [Pylaiella littoralis]